MLKLFLGLLLVIPSSCLAQEIERSDFFGSWNLNKCVRSKNKLPLEEGKLVDRLIRELMGSQWNFLENGDLVLFQTESSPIIAEMHIERYQRWEFNKDKLELVLIPWNPNHSVLRLNVKSHKSYFSQNMTTHRLNFQDYPLTMTLHKHFRSRER